RLADLGGLAQDRAVVSCDSRLATDCRIKKEDECLLASPRARQMQDLRDRRAHRFELRTGRRGHGDANFVKQSRPRPAADVRDHVRSSRKPLGYRANVLIADLCPQLGLGEYRADGREKMALTDTAKARKRGGNTDAAIRGGNALEPFRHQVRRYVGEA